jgi:endonuclease/exonuclease/phosphatase family metal-dependent hydrolase
MTRDRLTAVTWNVSFALGSSQAPGVKIWDDRRDELTTYVSRHDIIALQELSERQFADVRGALPNHRALAVSTPLPERLTVALKARFGTADSDLIEIALFFSKALSVLESGHCWLSPTPDKPLSTGYGNVAPRQLLWAVVSHEASARRIVVATTHVDHRAVEPMMRVIEERLQPPLTRVGAGVLLGDLNTHTAPHAIDILLRSGWRDTHPTGLLDEDHTYLGDLAGGPGRIDHLLAHGDVATAGWWRGTDVTDRGLSDHLPVGATLL